MTKTNQVSKPSLNFLDALLRLLDKKRKILIKICTYLEKSRFSCVQLFANLWTITHKAPLSVGFSSKNTVVGCHAPLQGIFWTLGYNPHLLHLLHW